MTAPQTGPSEEQVRALLTRHAEAMEDAMRDADRLGLKGTVWIEGAALYRAALALLDAGRKDRERIDALEQMATTDDVHLEEEGGLFVVDHGYVPRPVAESLRAAIDRARGA